MCGFRIALTMVFALLELSGVTLAVALPPSGALTGAWQGTLTVPGGSLRIVFHFAPRAEGGYTATLDSPDQGAQGIPCDSVAFEGGSLRVVVGVIGGKFEGTWPAGTDSIPGTWSQSGMAFPLALRYVGAQVEAPRRPQEPKAPCPYGAEEVSYRNPGGDTLAATLTLPSAGGPFPAVVLITGSGPEDRDESVFGHRPFLVLADYLTRRGIAVLRADDRGVGKSTGHFASATSGDFAADAAAGMAYLGTRQEIRRDRIGLLGHSEGGIVAPMVASEREDVAFVVLLAGTGVPGRDILLAQSALIARKMGASAVQIALAETLNKQIYDVVAAGGDSAATAAKVRELLLAAAGAEATVPPDSAAREATVRVQVRQVMSPWFRSFLTYDPRPALAKVRCPVLALGGELDTQVPAEENLREIDAALGRGGNRDVMVKLIPGVNHLFQRAAKGTPDEYSQIEETMSPEVLQLVGDWIVARVK
jgi:pimeloyl-ACP methyl ester carboxylesterase